MEFSHSAPYKTEDFRYERLYKVAQIIFLIDPKLHNKILRLHDHEGDLSVGWRNDVESHEQSLVKSIWELFGEYNIEHHIGDDFL